MTYVEYDLSAIAEVTDFVGNCMASGDDAFDKECEDSIRADLEAGNIWAWASIKVSARIGCIEGTNYLGMCSYKSEDDFRKDGYYLDMKGEALSDLRTELEGVLESAEKELATEREAYDKRV